MSDTGYLGKSEFSKQGFEPKAVKRTKLEFSRKGNILTWVQK